MDPHIGLNPNDHNLAWAALAMLVVPTAYLIAAIMTGRAVFLRKRSPSLARRLCVSSMCALAFASASVLPLGWLFVMTSGGKS